MSLRTIVVGVDDTEGSRVALDWAAELAAALGARVVVVHAFEPLAHLEKLAPGTDLAALRERAGELLAGPLCEPLRQRGVAHSTCVLEGDPAEVLVCAADTESADLIVVGARRQSRLQSLLLGSTSSRLAQMTRRPVTIVHVPGDPAAGGQE